MDRTVYKKDFKTHCCHDFSGSHGSGLTPFSTLCLSHGSFEILKLLCLEQSATDYVENLHISALQQMHIHTSKSPRATYKLRALFEELSCRQLYKLDQAWLDKSRVRSVNGLKDREDEVASDGLRGMADATSTLFECTENQARGSALGHSKVHSSAWKDLQQSLERRTAEREKTYSSANGLLQCLERLTAEINKLKEFSSGLHPTDELVESIVTHCTETYNQDLIASDSTRQYESSTLTAKQLVTVRQAELPEHITPDRRKSQFEEQPCRHEYKELSLKGCQVCIALHYLLHYSLSQELQVREEGEREESNVLQHVGLSWVFEEAIGELLHFIADITGRQATAIETIVSEKDFVRHIRFLHNHNQDHNCSGTCVKNVKKTSTVPLTKRLKPHRSSPCRFEFYHVGYPRPVGKHEMDQTIWREATRDFIYMYDHTLHIQMWSHSSPDTDAVTLIFQTLKIRAVATPRWSYPAIQSITTSNVNLTSATHLPD